MTRETPSRSHSEKRKDVRHEVHLKGRLHSEGKKFSLEVGDLSLSGALILVKGGPAVGTRAELWIEDYGPIAIQVMHLGAYFCGVAFVEPAAHRLRLQHWLGADTQSSSNHTARESDAPTLAADAA